MIVPSFREIIIQLIINHGMCPFITETINPNNIIRLMEGVRRWIGVNPTSTSRKPKALTKAYDEAQKEVPEAKHVDPSSSEGIVARLLSPTVSEAEEAEYQWCFFC